MQFTTTTLWPGSRKNDLLNGNYILSDFCGCVFRSNWPCSRRRCSVPSRQSSILIWWFRFCLHICYVSWRRSTCRTLKLSHPHVQFLINWRFVFMDYRLRLVELDTDGLSTWRVTDGFEHKTAVHLICMWEIWRESRPAWTQFLESYTK